MAKRKQPKAGALVPAGGGNYDGLLFGLGALLDQSRRSAARAVNAVLAATYWEVGRRVVEFEQGGEARASYGEELLKRLGADLSKKHGRGFGWRNLFSMRAFYLGWEIGPTAAGTFQFRAKPPEAEKLQTPSAISPALLAPDAFPLPWSHYVRLMTVPDPAARRFYEDEAIKGGWSVRQLDRQISTQFYERLAGRAGSPRCSKRPTHPPWPKRRRRTSWSATPTSWSS